MVDSGLNLTYAYNSTLEGSEVLGVMGLWSQYFATGMEAGVLSLLTAYVTL